MNKLRIHYFQHVAFENLGCIEEWIHKKGHVASATRFFENDVLPEVSTIDWLIVMGGPMAVYDEDQYPWLQPEKQFIKAAINNGKKVLGICLGAQLIASVLGASVYRNGEKEIGWFPITKNKAANASPLFKGLPEICTVFHWHGDRFDIPANALSLYSSEACPNQGFLLNKKVIGLQFHLEVTENSLQQMVSYGSDELIEGAFVQPAGAILANTGLIRTNNHYMFQLLDQLEDS